MAFKNRFFQKLNLPLFLPLQIIQFLFETFFNKSLRFQEISIRCLK